MGYERLTNDPQAWLAQVKLPEHMRSPFLDRGRYPSALIREHFLDPNLDLPSSTLRDVLRALLPTGVGPVGSDLTILKFNRARIADRLNNGTATEYERRLVHAELAAYAGRGCVAAPIPDLTWALDLAFINPTACVSVVHAYLSAHAAVLPDQVYDGLQHFMETVRAHFEPNASALDRLSVLRAIAPRQLEFLRVRA